NEQEVLHPKMLFDGVDQPQDRLPGIEAIVAGVLHLAAKNAQLKVLVADGFADFTRSHAGGRFNLHAARSAASFGRKRLRTSSASSLGSRVGRAIAAGPFAGAEKFARLFARYMRNPTARGLLSEPAMRKALLILMWVAACE